MEEILVGIFILFLCVVSIFLCCFCIFECIKLLKKYKAEEKNVNNNKKSNKEDNPL